MSETRTGKLLVLHDEYMLSDHGIQQAPDTETFISNIAKLFYRNNGGRFLNYNTYYITNSTIQGNGLENILSPPLLLHQGLRAAAHPGFSEQVRSSLCWWLRY
jgi:hypothetical protein